jgi:lysophospholipase L1-like esterase
MRPSSNPGHCCPPWLQLAPFTLACLLSATSAARADYALRDGDTVVFLGDSITAARTYGKIIENYTLLRFPERRVRFVNAGWGGDTAAGGLARLERDVISQHASVLIVAYGFNDIGWGFKADDEHKKKYLDAIRSIVGECKKRKIRVFICSAAITGADPARSEDSFLQKMCDEGMAIARELGEQSIDVQRAMREIHKRVWAFNAALKDDKGKVSLHAADGVHLNDLGQLAMAYAILKGLGAPAEVSAVTVDAQKPRLVEARSCTVTGLKAGPDGLEFVRLDEGRPINFGLFGALQFRFVPIPDQLNRYLLRVDNLPDGRYEVLVDGRLLGRFTNRQLAGGLNIASLTPDPWQPGGPWDAEATILSRLTDARSEVGVAQRFTGTYLPRQPNREVIGSQMVKVNAALEELQRTLVKPTPYHYVIRPTSDPTK